MRSKVVMSIMVIGLAACLVGGSTAAWFYAESPQLQSMFTAGTVDISGGEVVTDFVYGETLTWDITNNGSKNAFLRVKIEGDSEDEGETECVSGESAWTKGTPFGANWAMYFDYTVGEVKTVNFMAGQHHLAGTVTARIIGDDLHVNINLANDWTMGETHLYVKAVAPTNSAPGLLGHKHSIPPGSTSDEYIIPLSTFGSSNPTILYIAAHAEEVAGCYTIGGGSSGSITWNLCENSPWSLGTDGWWYYCTPVPPGESVEICLTPYGSGTGEYQLEAEAVQASNGAINFIWPGHPCQVSQ